MTHDSDVVILRALLDAESEFVSGSAIAKILGVSRVSVWSRLDRLRAEGFEFEAVRHRGYRLLKQPSGLRERLLYVYLERLKQHVNMTFMEAVDSTNSEASRALTRGDETPFVVISGAQTKGRGRLGRQWYSPDDGNIYASFGFRPQIIPSKMQTITLWMGLNLCDVLNQEYGIPVRLKWPNDLLLEGKKIAGMLTEARIDADCTHELVFGVGLNVNGDCKAWPEEIRAVATSLSFYKGEVMQPNQIAASLIQRALEAYDVFVEDDYLEALHQLWERYNLLKGRVISAMYRKEKIRGEVLGIRDCGSLRFLCEDGQELEINSGEVSIGSGNI